MGEDSVERMWQRVRVDNEALELWVRSSTDTPWVRVPTKRMVGQTLVAEAVLYVAWSGARWGAEPALDVAPGIPMISAFALDGTPRWTLTAGELPFYDHPRARGRGLAYLARIDGRILARSGPWFCELIDEGDRGVLGPLCNTGNVDTNRP